MDYADTAGQTQSVVPDSAKGEDPKYDVDYWAQQIEQAGKDQEYKDFILKGDKIMDRYLDKRDTAYFTRTSLNLFHSNVTTLQSMLFGQMPKVDVDRRHETFEDPVARTATLMLQRILNNQIGLRTDTFSGTLRKALTDYLTVGIGIARIRYEATFEDMEPDPALGADDLNEDEKIERLVGEDAPIEYVYWKDLLWKPSRCWEECNWIAFKTHLTHEQAAERFDEDIADKIEYKSRKLSDNDTQRDLDKTAEVYEIWCKDEKTVYWYCKGYPDLLDTKPDPLQLWGFYPIPMPMMANVTTRKLMPKADFTFEQDLYNEIDDIESRIMMLTRACKVVGVYDKANVGLQRMLQEGVENDLIPVDNWAMFAEKGGIKGTVDWLPIEAVSNCLQILAQQRDSAIQLLYQMTGMSDIIRGQSSEGRTSATEQSIKAKYASIRVQFLQDMFANFATDLQVLRTDVIATHFDPATILKQSNIQFDPQDQEYIQPAIQLIKDEKSALWRIQVRPESVAMVDYQQLKQERTDYIMAVSQYTQSMGPIIEQVPASMPYLLQLLKWGLAGFKGSQQIESIMDKAIQAATEAANQPEQPDPEAQKAQAEAQQSQAEFEQKMKGEQAKQQSEAVLAQMNQDFELKKMEMEAGFKQQEFDQKMQLMNREFEIKMAELAAEMQALKAKTAAEAESTAMKAAATAAAHNQKMEAMDETEKEDD